MIIDFGAAFEEHVLSTASVLEADLSWWVKDEETYEDTSWTILSSTLTGKYLTVVLIDLFDGAQHIENLLIEDLFKRIISNRIADEARQLQQLRTVSSIHTEIISFTLVNRMLRYQVKWSYQEGRPTRRRNVTFVGTGSLVL